MHNFFLSDMFISTVSRICKYAPNIFENKMLKIVWGEHIYWLYHIKVNKIHLYEWKIS